MLRTDKTNCTVAMYKHEYIEKMEMLLSDTSIYHKLNKNPTNRIMKEHNELISKLFKSNKIDEKLNLN